MTEILIEYPESDVVSICINRPAQRNAVSLAMWQELTTVFNRLANRRDVRLVILTGNGGHFCAGADISEFDQVRGDAEQGAAYDAQVDYCYEALSSLRQPSVAAISGYAIGGGCALAMACDFRVAHTNACFGIPASKLGLVYSVRECQFLIGLVGLSNAKKILYSGEQLDAPEAKQVGLVDTVVEQDPIKGVFDFAARMRDKAPLSIAGAKLILQSIAHGRLSEETRSINAAIEQAFNSEDYQEGARAFLEKRRPRFRGQ